jgi:hypothetical protein
MAEMQVPHVQCDFCGKRIPTAAKEADDFHKVDDFDLCSACFNEPFKTISHGVGEAWFLLARNDEEEGAGPYNGKVVQLITKLCQIALHEQVGGAKTE